MKSKKIGMQALKIAIGSSLAIYIANLFGLKYSLAAGSVALLTMVTRKWNYNLGSRLSTEGKRYLCFFCGYCLRDDRMGSDDFCKCTDRNAFSGSQRF